MHTSTIKLHSIILMTSFAISMLFTPMEPNMVQIQVLFTKTPPHPPQLTFPTFFILKQTVKCLARWQILTFIATKGPLQLIWARRGPVCATKRFSRICQGQASERRISFCTQQYMLFLFFNFTLPVSRLMTQQGVITQANKYTCWEASRKLAHHDFYFWSYISIGKNEEYQECEPGNLQPQVPVLQAREKI